MQITKHGHSCLSITYNEAHILIDPGKWNVFPNVSAVDVLLITHEHADHFALEHVQKLALAHPAMRIVTHTSVGTKLAEVGIPYETIEDRQTIDVKGVSVQSYGTEHACVYGDVSPCRNTGFLIGGELFISGDALTEFPDAPVRVLALPCGGPWMKFSEAITYAKKVQPKMVFPVHDGMYKEEIRSDIVPRIIGGNLQTDTSTFIDMAPGSSHDFSA